MATFEDNAVVTAEDLNNIAVDLGDTTFSAFSEEKFGVDKLNEITADLVSKGILTTGDRCEPVVSGGKVYIKSGVIVFGSGAKIKITEPVEVGAAAGDYIYAYNDVLTGKASIMASTDKPTAGDYVMLAQLDSTGTLTDKRTLSVAKALSAVDFSVQTFSDTAIVDKKWVNNSTEYHYVNGEIELGNALTRRLVGIRVPDVYMYYSEENQGRGTFNCFYDFTNIKSHKVNSPGIGSRRLVYLFELDGSTLKWVITEAEDVSFTNGEEFRIEVDMI